MAIVNFFTFVLWFVITTFDEEKNFLCKKFLKFYDVMAAVKWKIRQVYGEMQKVLSVSIEYFLESNRINCSGSSIISRYFTGVIKNPSMLLRLINIMAISRN